MPSRKYTDESFCGVVAAEDGKVIRGKWGVGILFDGSGCEGPGVAVGAYVIVVPGVTGLPSG